MTPHLLADHVNSHEELVALRPAVFLWPASQLENRSSSAVSTPPFATARVHRACARLAPKPLTMGPLAGQLQRHFNGRTLLNFGFKIADFC